MGNLSFGEAGVGKYWRASASRRDAAWAVGLVLLSAATLGGCARKGVRLAGITPVPHDAATQVEMLTARVDDMILDSVQTTFSNSPASSTGKGHVSGASGFRVYGSRRWPNGIIPVSVDPGLPGSIASSFWTACQEWASTSHARCVARNGEAGYLYVSHAPSPDICDSEVGAGTGSQQRNTRLGDRCATYAAVLHEVGHVLGFMHEHQRPDRDDYLDVNVSNALPQYAFAFDKLAAMENVHQYDFLSIMHYQARAGSANGRPVIWPKAQFSGWANIMGTAGHLSQTDRDTAAGMYDGTSDPVVASKPADNGEAERLAQQRSAAQRQFVEQGYQAYRQVLGREPEAAAVAGFNDQFAAGWSSQYLRVVLAMSQESANNIQDAFRRFLNREASQAEITSWQGALQTGTLASLKSGIAHSDEAAQWLRQYSIDVLGRDPGSVTADQARAWWADALYSLGSQSALRQMFAQSDEATSRIWQLAVTELHRDPGSFTPAQARDWWGAVLLNGGTLADVRQAFASSIEGLAQGVFLSAEVFDATWYLANYADLASAFGTDVDAARKHWLTSGISEGRLGSPLFSSSEYLGMYADLQGAFGPQDFKTAMKHYVQSGIAEGRAGRTSLRGEVFNPAWYLGAYADLAAAFGSDLNAARFHWLSNGIGEGRQGAPGFSSRNYLARYPDLTAAFTPGGFAAAIDHYIRYGISEGRNGQ